MILRSKTDQYQANNSTNNTTNLANIRKKQRVRAQKRNVELHMKNPFKKQNKKKAVIRNTLNKRNTVMKKAKNSLRERLKEEKEKNN